MFDAVSESAHRESFHSELQKTKFIGSTKRLAEVQQHLSCHSLLYTVHTICCQDDASLCDLTSSSQYNLMFCCFVHVCALCLPLYEKPEPGAWQPSFCSAGVLLPPSMFTADSHKHQGIVSKSKQMVHKGSAF